MCKDEEEEEDDNDDDDNEGLTSCAMFEGPNRGHTLRPMASIYSCLSKSMCEKHRSII
jgi:hypothetical protein